MISQYKSLDSISLDSVRIEEQILKTGGITVFVSIEEFFTILPILDMQLIHNAGFNSPGNRKFGLFPVNNNFPF
jgi:hypothetical protein